MANSPAIETQLKQLRQSYQRSLTDKLYAIEDSWRGLTRWDRDALEQFHRLIHTLAGSSATFGLTSLSQTARTLEHFLQERSNTTPLSLEDRQHITTLLLQLRNQIEVCRTQGKSPQVSLKDDCDFSPLSWSASVRSSQTEQRLVFLVEDDPDVAQELSLQISYFGYQVCTFDRPELLKSAMVEASPAAVIMDIVFPEGDLAGTQAIVELNQWRMACRQVQTSQPPVIFMSVRDDLLARLQSVRAGGDAYFTKPVNVNELIDKLDRLIDDNQPDPYRILIVEDDPELAEFHALTLQQAGMLTQIITDSMGVMQPLSEFKPDLILMDIYMPLCSGLELAAVIRQQPAYVSIPIVFLSTETNVDKQLAAMSLGGDDFLTKPIQPEHLIASVSSRAQRSATLRALMVRDSLTGLLNHTKLKEQLSTEIKRAKRQNVSLAFAMIDIDHFKRVNDTYGHPAGDRVIKSLSRLLQQRLRRTDIIGRYGGEEFAAILVDTDASAVQVINQIRQSFAQIQQWAEGNEFTVTFSCGIALSPDFSDATEINRAADRALYRAKQAGRNQVVFASGEDD